MLVNARWLRKQLECAGSDSNDAGQDVHAILTQGNIGRRRVGAVLDFTAEEDMQVDSLDPIQAGPAEPEHQIPAADLGQQRRSLSRHQQQHRRHPDR